MHRFAKLLAGMRKEIKQQSNEISKLVKQNYLFRKQRRGPHAVVKHATLLSATRSMAYRLGTIRPTHNLTILYPYTQDPEATNETVTKCNQV